MLQELVTGGHMPLVALNQCVWPGAACGPAVTPLPTALTCSPCPATLYKPTFAFNPPPVYAAACHSQVVCFHVGALRRRFGSAAVALEETVLTRLGRVGGVAEARVTLKVWDGQGRSKARAGGRRAGGARAHIKCHLSRTWPGPQARTKSVWREPRGARKGGDALPCRHASIRAWPRHSTGLQSRGAARRGRRAYTRGRAAPACVGRAFQLARPCRGCTGAKARTLHWGAKSESRGGAVKCAAPVNGAGAAGWAGHPGAEIGLPAPAAVNRCKLISA